ncbi:MAG: hypothetical protein GH151_10280 [Bacteroidetes bacterium]|nr:hypothetical protein [Bacteroidota bacterium]
MYLNKKIIFTLFVVYAMFVSCQQQKGPEQKPRDFNGSYSGEYLNRVAFPIGGIGAGMFCLEGTGAISHMSVRNRPEVFNEPCMFAAISLKGFKNGAKVLEGQVPDWKKFGPPNTGLGSGGTSWGLPRFESAKFLARFPFAYVDLDDKELPLEVQLRGWSPFIPTDADNSSLPMGAIEYSFKNTGNSEFEAVFSYNSENFMRQSSRGAPGTALGRAPGKASIKPIPNGFVLSEEGAENAPNNQGDFAIFTNEPNTVVDYCWFRGGWFDGVTMVWNTISNGEIKSNSPIDLRVHGASLYVPFTLKPGETKVIRLMMAWYVPNTVLRYGRDPEPVPEVPCCDANYKPWYTNRFKDIIGVVNFWETNYDDLREKSEQFKEAFYASTLPAEVTEAVAANLTILKSPTVLRQADGRLWCWEGCRDNSGSCAGSCTHVWNYAQAIPHLFPQLERTLRETEFLVSQNEEGHQTFRSALPIRSVVHNFHAASDGQLGGIMKVYREWRIFGDTEWLKKLLPKVRKSIDYCIKTWDPRGNGVLEEPHHNTYDIEFWGPDGMCTSFYLGALKAMVEMGKYIGEDITRYNSLLTEGKKYMERELFNDEYFIQKIQVDGLNAISPVEAAKKSLRSYYSEEAIELLEKEGPKYQYGTGCLSDGILGAWIAEMSGLNEFLDQEKVKSHLKSVYKYNLKQDLRYHANPQRPSYAVGNEGGLLLCTWPKGGELSLPFVYSNEVWTGIEYQVASHLMMKGEVEKGLDIVRTCRERYDGKIRNPFNEYECGHWYARAMSSYGLIQGLTGIRYDAVDKTLFIDSRIGNDFRAFISTETGFGTAGLKNGNPFIEVKEGHIEIEQFNVSGELLKN